MIDVNELRKGVTFQIDKDIYKVLDYHHNKPGRGAATIRIKARNLRTGATIDKTFGSGEKVQDIRLEYRTVQYLYSDGDLYYFMDTDTFEQPGLSVDILGDYVGYLQEGIEVKLTYFGTEPIDIELPTTVDFEVIEAEASVRGDTATGVNKKVKVQTGQEFSVPAFINTGDVIRVDTRTGEYVTRVQN